MSSIDELDLHTIQVLANASVSVAMAFLPLLLESKGLSNYEIGIIAIPYSFFLILSNTIFGRLSDTKGRRPFLLTGMIASAFTMFCYTMPTNFNQFIIIRILHGISFGIYPSAFTGIASDRKVKLGRLSSFGSLGWAIGALFGGIIANFSSLEIIFVISAFVFFIAYIVAFFLGTGKEIEIPNLQLGKLNAQPNAYRISLLKNHKEYLLIILRHGTANAIWIYWTLYLQNDLGLNLSSIGVVQVINMFTQFVMMKKFTDRFAPRKMLLLGGFISALAFFSFTLATNFFQIATMQIILGVSWAFFFVGGLRSVEENS